MEKNHSSFSASQTLRIFLVLKKLHRIFVSHVLSSCSLSLTPVPAHHFCCFSCSHNDSTGCVQYPSTTSPNRISSPSKTPDGTGFPIAVLPAFLCIFKIEYGDQLLERIYDPVLSHPGFLILHQLPDIIMG